MVQMFNNPQGFSSIHTTDQTLVFDMFASDMEFNDTVEMFELQEGN